MRLKNVEAIFKKSLKMRNLGVQIVCTLLKKLILRLRAWKKLTFFNLAIYFPKIFLPH